MTLNAGSCDKHCMYNVWYFCTLNPRIMQFEDTHATNIEQRFVLPSRYWLKSSLSHFLVCSVGSGSQASFTELLLIWVCVSLPPCELFRTVLEQGAVCTHRGGTEILQPPNGSPWSGVHRLDEWCIVGGLLYVTIHIPKWQGVFATVGVWCGAVWMHVWCTSACLWLSYTPINHNIKTSYWSAASHVFFFFSISWSCTCNATWLLFQPIHTILHRNPLVLSHFHHDAPNRSKDSFLEDSLQTKISTKALVLSCCVYARGQIQYIMLVWAPSHCNSV